MIVIANFLIIAFGLFLIFSGFLMFFKPEKVRVLIGKAGSTYLINYTELGIRLIVGIAFLINSFYSNYEIEFKVLGYFLSITAIILMFIPIKIHNRFSRKAASFLRPIYLKLIAPISVFFGLIVLYAILNNLNITDF